MGNGLEETENRKPQKRWWLDWSILEKGFSVLLILAVLFITTLVVVILLFTKKPEPIPAPQSCDTPTCAQEALQILTRIDTQVDPCKDFHAFACNNAPTSTAKQDYIGPFLALTKQANLDLEELYSEPVRKQDHHLVKVQKKMYEACLNESAIATYALRTIKEILKAGGGWPVVEGPEWDRSKFDWVQASSKLRQLGYHYSSFLELKIVPDPKNTDKYIFKVVIPQVDDIYSRWFNSDEPNTFMADVAEMFGAQVHHALDEMSKTHQFLKDLQWMRFNNINDNRKLDRTTIIQLQKKEDTIDWLKFIRAMAGPDVRISENDFVLFPPVENLDQWFAVLNRTSSRIQANYMVWRVVEELLPFLTENLLERGIRPRFMAGRSYLQNTRSEFCMEEISKRFTLNPLDVMYLRKYLPKSRAEEVRQLVTNFTLEVEEVIRNVEWLEPKDKNIFADRLGSLNVVIGAPGDYFSDKMFSHMHFELNKLNSRNFLNLLSQANRNNDDALFSLINKSTKDTRLNFWPNLMAIVPWYNGDKNELYFPVISLQEPMFKENRPNYLNFAHMGLVFKYSLIGILQSDAAWSHKSAEAFDKRKKCLIDGARLGNVSIPDHLVVELTMHILSTKATYAAYSTWTKNNEEDPLIAMDYTPNQLFWLSYGHVFCPYATPYENNYAVDDKTAKAYSSVVKRIINNNPETAKDFGCPVKSEETFEEACKVF